MPTAHGVGCARLFRRECRRLGGDSQRVRRRQRRRCRQERGATVAAVWLPVSASKGYRLTAWAVRVRSGANVGGLAAIVSASGGDSGDTFDRITGSRLKCRRLCGCLFRLNRRGLAVDADSGDTFDRNAPRPAATAATPSTGTRRVRRGSLRRRATGSRRGLCASVPAESSAAVRPIVKSKQASHIRQQQPPVVALALDNSCS